MRKSLFAGAAAAAILLMAGPALAATVVPLAPFKSVGLSGGGHIVLRQGAVQSVTLLKGSTQFTTFKVNPGGGLNIVACNESCPHDYDLDIEIVLPSVEGVAIEGGGTIKAEGGFPAVRAMGVAISGGGNIDVRAVPAANVDAAVNGGGMIETAPSGALNAAVNGGGVIVYWGNPAVHQVVSGGGAVKHAAAP